MDKIVRKFLAESYENLDRLEQDMVSLEPEPGSKELLSSIFRAVHTIKGTSGSLAFDRLEKLAHRGENLLSELHDGVHETDQETVDMLLFMVDRIRATMGSVGGIDQEGDVDIDSVTTQTKAIQGKIESAAKPTAGQVPYETEEIPAEVPLMTNVPGKKGETSTGEPAGVPFMTNILDEKGQTSMGAGTSVAQAEAKPEPAPTKPTQFAGTTVATADSKKGTKSVDHPTNDHGRLTAESSIRVGMGLFGMLVHEVSELVLVRNQTVWQTDNISDMNLAQPSQRLSIVATELREGIMKIRIQSIEHLWSKVPRVVRDPVKQTGKKVKLVMIGGDTELDRSLLGATEDPLTHMVRSAVDHGAESPGEYKAAGKDPEGIITIRTYHVGSQVIVDIIDDGADIDPVVATNKALDKGLVASTQLQSMSDKDIFNMLFLPGLSTTKRVFNISGCRVSTDVMETSVGAIGGMVDAKSELGHGSTQRVRILLTLVIQSSLTVESYGELYTISQASLLELVALDSSRKETSMEYTGASPVYRLRGTLLSLIRLGHVLHPEETERYDEEVNGVIAVLRSGDQRFGLVIDKVINNKEIVVKPLSPRLKSIGLYAGATLLSNGRVTLILDAETVARRSLIGAPTQAAQKAQTVAGAAQARASGAIDRALVVGIGGGCRVVIPLAAVTRLEHVNAEKVERVGGYEVIQCRGQVLPIVRLDRLLGVMDYEEPKDLRVAMYNHGDHSMAMVVHEILDIVSDDKRKYFAVEDHGLLGSVVLKDRVTELLDVEQTVCAADLTFFDEIDDFNTELELGSRLDMVGA